MMSVINSKMLVKVGNKLLISQSILVHKIPLIKEQSSFEINVKLVFVDYYLRHCPSDTLYHVIINCACSNIIN